MTEQTAPTLDVQPAAPVAETVPVVAPAPTPEASPAIAETTTPVAGESVAPVSTASETPVSETTITETVPAPDAADSQQPETSPPTEEPQTPAQPVYEFKMPDGVTASDDILGAYRNILTKGHVSPELGQELLDFHATQMRAAQKAMEQAQRDAFEKTRAGWLKQVNKQFGNRRDTAIADAKWLIYDSLGMTKAEKNELESVLGFTGAGDHPAIIRWASRIAKKLREGSAPQPSVPLNPARDKTPWDRRYRSNGAST